QGYSQLSILDTQRFSASRNTESMQALIERAQQQNLALLSSRIAQDVAKDNIALASSGHLPSLKLNGGYNYARESNSNNSANNTD
ncbi:TolC family protein, partial [Bacillus cereus group sp. BC334]